MRTKLAQKARATEQQAADTTREVDRRGKSSLCLVLPFRRRTPPRNDYANRHA